MGIRSFFSGLDKQEKLAWAFFSLGFFTVTWDRVGTFRIPDGPNFRLSFFAFFLAFISLAYRNPLQFWRQLREGPLATRFARCVLLLALFYFATIPFSSFLRKTFLYDLWLIFELLVVWSTAYVLAPKLGQAKIYLLVGASIGFLSLIILIDQIAYHFGYIGGFIGYNQDIELRWGLSRPSAFAYEPSYIATTLSMGLATLTSVLWGLRKKLPWLMILLALSFFALVVTTSRTGWISIGFNFGLIVFFTLVAEKKFPWRLFFSLLSLSLVAGGVFFWTTPPQQQETLNNNLVSSMVNGTDGSGGSRLRAMKASVIMAEETHWMGVGLGASYIYWLKNHAQIEMKRDPTTLKDVFGKEAVMSTWCQLLAEGGFIAVILYLLAGLSLVWPLYRNWQQDPSGGTSGALAAAIVFFVFTAHFIGNVARADVWVWLAIWGALPLTKPDITFHSSSKPQSKIQTN